MKKGTLISILIALVAVAGALLGLVAYMRSRRCLECSDEDLDEDFLPDTEADYEEDCCVEDYDMPPVEEPEEKHPGYVSAPVASDEEPEE